ncbi:hypothetical protein CL620_06175 [archaeon]|nr:hypothetical protein [archaeon]|tara:strand:- start:157 stop:414 length:258 start_codon:yes stop_codon:yes gene_type:complete
MDELLEDMREPIHYRIYILTLENFDRIVFGADRSIRRKIFGVVPFPLAPAYAIYDYFDKKRVGKVLHGVPHDLRRIVVLRSLAKN